VAGDQWRVGGGGADSAAGDRWATDGARGWRFRIGDGGRRHVASGGEGCVLTKRATGCGIGWPTYKTVLVSGWTKRVSFSLCDIDKKI
jgi:hypothetical protein